jgi:predicted alpha/beta superfamily hydrolase
MKARYLWLLYLLSTFSVQAIAQNKVTGDSLIFTEFHSKILGEKRRMIVHLPANYLLEPTKHYPVFYVLDGGSQDVHTTDQLAVLARAGILQESIVVGVLNGKGTRNRDQTPPFMRTETEDPQSVYGNADKFLSFLTEEIVPQIDSTYRTNKLRTLSGHSRGGLFVLYTLMQKANFFDAYFCYSTPVWRFEDLMIKKMDNFLNTPSFKKNTFLFLGVGARETENIIGGNQRLRHVFSHHKNKMLRVEHAIFPFADHQQNPVSATPKALAIWGNYLSNRSSLKNK